MLCPRPCSRARGPAPVQKPEGGFEVACCSQLWGQGAGLHPPLPGGGPCCGDHVHGSCCCSCCGRAAGRELQVLCTSSASVGKEWPVLLRTLRGGWLASAPGSHQQGPDSCSVEPACVRMCMLAAGMSLQLRCMGASCQVLTPCSAALLGPSLPGARQPPPSRAAVWASEIATSA